MVAVTRAVALISVTAIKPSIKLPLSPLLSRMACIGPSYRRQRELVPQPCLALRR